MLSVSVSCFYLTQFQFQFDKTCRVLHHILLNFVSHLSCKYQINIKTLNIDEYFEFDEIHHVSTWQSYYTSHWINENRDSRWPFFQNLTRLQELTMYDLTATYIMISLHRHLQYGPTGCCDWSWKRWPCLHQVLPGWGAEACVLWEQWWHWRTVEI